MISDDEDVDLAYKLWLLKLNYMRRYRCNEEAISLYHVLYVKELAMNDETDAIRKILIYINWFSNTT